jgi:hypothetical protein
MADGWRDTTPPTGCAWESLPPGPELAVALHAADPCSLDGPQQVSYLSATERLATWVHVIQARALTAVREAIEVATAGERGAPSLTQSWVADEVAAALHIAPRTATLRVNAARAVMSDWPALGSALAQGALTVAQAREIYEGVAILAGTVNEQGEDLSEVAVRDLLRIAATLPPARLRERVARHVASLDPDAASRRRRQAERDLTDVSMWAEADGMACLAARGPAVDALSVRDVIDGRARQMRERASEDDTRSLGQWRHAALLEAFGLVPTGSLPTSFAAGSDIAEAASVATTTPQVHVRVTVPLTTLLELDDSPAELEGYGPIDADLARALATDGEWIRWVTDPVGDYLIDEGRRRFPGARLARFLRARESRCKHPSCGVRSRRCDADHLKPYAHGGRTAAATMSPTCPRHNRHRDASGWTLAEQGPHDPSAPPGPVWRSPLGRHYETSLSTPLTLDFVPLRT